MSNLFAPFLSNFLGRTPVSRSVIVSTFSVKVTECSFVYWVGDPICLTTVVVSRFFVLH